MEGRYWHAATRLAAVAALVCVGCGGGGGGNEISGTINTGRWYIPAGEVRTVVGDLIVNADEVQIDGTLTTRAATAGTPGFSITLHAKQSILINGTATAGNAGVAVAGQPGAAGGKLELLADAGSITVGAGARFGSGNGGSGGAGNSPGLAGGRGGDLVIKAPAGAVQIHAHAQVMHLGNGGMGGPVAASSLPSGVAVQLTNGGGESGDLVLEAATFTGLPLAVPFNGQNLFIDNRNGYITGGAGGSAGSIDQSRSGPDPVTRGRADGAPYGPVTGASGASGWQAGGAGESVGGSGGAGSNGGKGGDATCTGGAGGDIKTFTVVIGGQTIGIVLLPAYPGDGGQAMAVGGRGGDGNGAGAAGGVGGKAEGTGGRGGDIPNGVLQTGGGPGGDGGSGTAVGGDGGNGGSGCPPGGGQGAAGGNGGNGGVAIAVGGRGGVGDYGGRGGDATSNGGSGGKGGNGDPPGGGGGAGGGGATRGSGGNGLFQDGSPGTATQSTGATGQDGQPCPTGSTGGNP